MIRLNTIGRFEAKFKKLRKGKCWEWTASRSTSGYGHFREKGKTLQAHRFSYSFYLGPIPIGMCVLHKCDVRHCVNPDHLFLGTHDINNKDRAAKGRSAVGEKHARHRFTTSDILAIRADPRPIRQIGKSYSTGHGVISLIKNRKRWQWLP